MAGEAMRDRAQARALLASLLDPDERRCDLFGRSPIDPMLAGFAFGSAFHAYAYRRHDRHRQAERLCGIFNFGIALFDRVCDREVTFRPLMSALDRPTLRRWLQEPVGITAAADSAIPLSLRTLLQVIRAFALEVTVSTRITKNSGKWTRLQDLLMEAYDSQILCAWARFGRSVGLEMLRCADTRKATAPFEIMLALVRVCEEDFAEIENCRADEACELVGTIFALIDHLSDLESDLRGGHPNSIALQAGLEPIIRSPTEIESIGLFLQRGGYIDCAVDDLCRSLTKLNRLAESTVHMGVGSRELPLLALEYATQVPLASGSSTFDQAAAAFST
jgi:hypothetical protein